MGGAVSSGALGLFYQEDPSWRKRRGSMVHKYLDRYQVLVPEGKLLKVIAECLEEEDALILMNRYNRRQCHG